MNGSSVRIDGTPKSGWSIVALHGGPGLDHSYFWPYLEPLTKRNRVVSYQQGTVQPSARPSIESLIEELTEVVKETAKDGSRICLIGHSFGGALALEYLARKKVKLALVLSNWICNMEWLPIYQKRNEMAANRASAMAAAQEGTSDNKEQFKIRMLSYLDDYFTKESRDNGRTVLEQIAYAPEIGDPIEAEYCASLNLDPVLQEINWPILSLAAESDRVIFPEYHQALAQKYRCLQHQVIRGGHFPFVENSAGFCHAIETYLNLINTEGYL